ncbi:MAG: CehA/McbA family metallohydrolase [Myxococcaceae bacterium]|nr:CehA/McbA family metallohydrolase [Myxococcaceae bacterium]
MSRAPTAFRSLLPIAVAFTLIARTGNAEPLVLEGEVPDDGAAFFSLPFEVPAGTKEIEVRHDDLSDQNILDWGLEDPKRFRGWGGGNTEPAIVGEAAASRSYLPGPLPAGTWKVIVGKAKIVDPPARYHVEVELRGAPTLAPQTERTPYVPSPPLKTGARWYAGDFHVHSWQSGDAHPTLDEIAAFAKSRGLDFVAISDHNTVAQLDYLVDAQSRSPDVLLMPSVEFTTYAGHANGIGATRFVDFRLAAQDGGIDEAVRQFHEMGALFSVNHPALDLGTLCIGCKWDQPLDPRQIDAVEIETGGYEQAGVIFLIPAMQFWESVLRVRPHTPAIGGSDDHLGGAGADPGDSPIGSPTTLVWASELSAEAILDGIRAGRTVVKTQGPDDPMVDLRAGDARVGDTVTGNAARGDQIKLTAVITGAAGQQARLVRNGKAEAPFDVTSDPFTWEQEVSPPDSGGQEDRYRIEVLVDGKPRTITSHLYVAAAPPEPEPGSEGCGCGVAPGTAMGWAVVMMLMRRRRAS